jgi:hypothetical protein
LEGRDLREKETMVFPGQLGEVATVPEEHEAQRAIERDRPFKVANHDLANELFSWVDVCVRLATYTTVARRETSAFTAKAEVTRD